MKKNNLKDTPDFNQIVISGQKKKIFKRNSLTEIVKFLHTDDVLVLHGARQVGKTHILYWLENFLKEKNQITHYMDLEDSRLVKILDSGVENFLQYLKTKNLIFANKKTFVFIDEIQYLKNPSSFLKLLSDHHKNIKLIVSGSSSFEIKHKFQDSLVGRSINFEIFNLSFDEFLKFKNTNIDLSQAKNFLDITLKELKKYYQEYTLFGGYPKIVLENNLEIKEKYLQQIIDTYLKKDIRDLGKIEDIEKFNKLLETLASQSGNLLNETEISNTCKIARPTLQKYLFILENTYIIKLVKPYHNNIRSELFKTPKIYFYDSGIMQMLWLKTLQKQIIDNVFETSIFGELVKNFGREKIFYWRTKDKKEIDFILRCKNEILPIEVKLNFAKFNSTAINYFNQKYNLKKYKVIGLGNKQINYQVNSVVNFAYPWEI
jgi:uncharacterized protein